VDNPTAAEWVNIRLYSQRNLHTRASKQSRIKSPKKSLFGPRSMSAGKLLLLANICMTDQRW
jgi:hypothetical protein